MEDILLYEQYVEDNCNSAIEKIKAGELDSIGVHAYIRHIPIRSMMKARRMLLGYVMNV